MALSHYGIAITSNNDNKKYLCMHDSFRDGQQLGPISPSPVTALQQGRCSRISR